MKNKKKQMGQFFTPPLIADRLVQCLNQQIKTVLDLGCGQGQLGLSVLKFYPQANYIGIEKDQEYFQSCKLAMPEQNIVHIDVIDNEALSSINNLMPVDTVIGNPPFINIPACSALINEIRKSIPGLVLFRNRLRSEILFIARSLERLRIGGQASFILPMSFFTSEQYQYFRKHIISNFSAVSLFELPSHVFTGADVSTCILSFNYKYIRDEKITLGCIKESGIISDSIRIDAKHALDRMDYSYHKLLAESGILRLDRLTSISAVGGIISRGNRSRAELSNDKIKYFHTTSFPKDQTFINLDNEIMECAKYAEEGDILLARVGSRCLDKQVIVASGRRAITDCIYKIRVPNENIEQVIRALSSKYGKVWRQMNAKGSCARYITKESLLSMPLFE
ncbi:HsdM family class I SAM-dependent methyltransferase [Nitrosomonas ureae]|uniref:HsdM family class I SAM-dependent methyltransferase n=1 Tax=Nitrosomonas ureae TaxID=44577 RepID=UPI0015A23895|nr:N-6 DNA methylase [Nitrosomonas ureae]